MQDLYGTVHNAATGEAVAAFEAATRAVAAHRPAAGEALARALAHDPHLAAAHALAGLSGVILARAETLPGAARSLAAARAAAQAKGGASPSETALIDALALAHDGGLRAAADRLDRHLETSPHEFLSAKLAHALRFMAGDVAGMRAGTERVLPAWEPDRPGYGFLLGCHAFALEETGDLAAAERAGRRAVAHEPEDSWGLHAVSHVHEMQGRTGEGIAWLEAARPVWSACNNFSFHMAWHLALFHLERGDHARVLAVYDAEVRPQPTDDFRDMANAVSLLWRLEQEGVAVGRRWDELRDLALARRADTTLTFACLHNLLALVASGEEAAARELADAIGRRARDAAAARDEGRACPEQGTVMAEVGTDLAGLILSLTGAGEGGRRSSPGDLALRLQRVGGSHAQRDVFLRTLAAAAAEGGDGIELARVLGVRRRLKRDDRFAAAIRARLDARREGGRTGRWRSASAASAAPLTPDAWRTVS